MRLRSCSCSVRPGFEDAGRVGEVDSCDNIISEATFLAWSLLLLSRYEVLIASLAART